MGKYFRKNLWRVWCHKSYLKWPCIHFIKKPNSIVQKWVASNDCCYCTTAYQRESFPRGCQKKKAFNSEFYERRIKKQVVQQIPEIPVVVNKSTSASHYMKRLYLANHSVSCLNNSTPAIKFTCNDSNKEINFLDDKKRLSRMGKTQETKISTNKTNIRLWTEFEVCFFSSPHWKTWNPYSPNTRATKKTSHKLQF